MAPAGRDGRPVDLRAVTHLDVTHHDVTHLDVTHHDVTHLDVDDTGLEHAVMALAGAPLS